MEKSCKKKVKKLIFILIFAVLISLASVNADITDVLIDDFNRADNTSLGQSLIGEMWVQNVGTDWEIVSNAIYSNTDGTFIATVSPGVNLSANKPYNVSSTMSFTTQANAPQNIGFCFFSSNSTDGSNHWCIDFYEGARMNSAGWVTQVSSDVCSWNGAADPDNGLDISTNYNITVGVLTNLTVIIWVDSLGSKHTTHNCTLSGFTEAGGGGRIGYGHWAAGVAIHDDLSISYSSAAVSDTTPPSFSNAWNSSDTKRYTNITINITATDADNNVDNMSLCHNESGTWNCPYNVTAIGASSYNLSYNFNVTNRVFNQTFHWNTTACDNKGNCNNSGTYIITIANTIPTVSSSTITSSDNLNRTNGTLTGSWETTDVDNSSITLNQTKWYKNATEQTTLENLTSLSSANTSKTEIWIFSVRSYDGANWSSYLNSSNLTIANTAPNSPSSIVWSTTGGFTDDTLTYNQIIDYVNVTCTQDTSDNDLLGCNITVYKPDGSYAVDNQAMTNASNNYEYTTDFTLNQAGTWNITITAFDGTDAASNSTTFTVSTQNISTTDGWYGCTNGTIASQSEITYYSGYGCDLIEINTSILNLNNTWTSLLLSINNSYDANIHIGLNFLFDFNYSNTTITNNIKNNITLYFPDLKDDPYSITIEYISFELANQGSYTASEKDGNLNNISNTATDAMDNNFVVYSKNYNSSGMDNSYIQYTTMLYLEESTKEGMINRENSLMRNYTSLNRIYIKLNSTLMSQTQSFQTNVIDILRASPVVTSVANKTVAELSNGDIVVFNNESSLQEITVNVSLVSGSLNKDVWDTTNKWLIETDTDLLFNVNASAYSANVIFFEDLDHINMDSNAESTIYKATSTGSKTFNWTDGTNDGNWAIDGFADEIRIELFDPHYTINNFITYYGWFNASYVSNWSNYEIVIADDENPSEVAKLIANTTTTLFYFYISVADYENTAAWQTAKETEVDNIIALNDSTRIHIFADGLDTGIGGTNFSTRMKELVDYIKITKGRNVGLNTYTAYESFCTWSQPDGFCMKESCIRRWNGASASAPDNYTWEDWNLELNKSVWYNSHNIKILCQAFDNRTSDTFEPKNWTIVQDTYFASRVLGYDYFYQSQPDFNYAHTIYQYDVGTDTAQSHSTDDNETYYRRYSNGIVYYNSSSHHGWIDDGRETDVQVCFRLYDSSDTAGDEDMDWEFRVNNISTTNSYQYTILAEDITAGVWNWYCTKLNETHESTTGNYQIEATTTDAGTAADAISIGYENYDSTGKHSWYSDAAGDPTWTVYASSQNWEVAVIVNETKKASLDTFTKITQTNITGNGRTNITLSSNYSYSVELWSNPITIANYRNLSYWNGTIMKAMSPTNNSDCDSNNPTWGSSTIDGKTYKSCIEPSGTNTLVRVAPPSLSTQVFTLQGNSPPTAPTSNLTDGYINNINETVGWSCTDAEGDTITYYVWFDTNADPVTLVQSNTSSIFKMNITSLTTTTYYYKGMCSDGTENSSNSSAYSYTFDITLPVRNVYNPTNNSYTKNASGFWLNYTVTDETEVYTDNYTVYYQSNNTVIQSNFSDDMNVTTFSRIEWINWSGENDSIFNIRIKNYDSHSGKPIKDLNIIDEVNFDSDTFSQYDLKENVWITQRLIFVDIDTKEKKRNKEIVKGKQEYMMGETKSTQFKATIVKTSFNFTIDKKGDIPVVIIESNKKISYQPESSYAGHLIWVPYVTDFESAKTIKVNGKEVSTKIEVEVYNTTLVYVKIIPEIELEKGDFVEIDPETQGLNLNDKIYTITKDTTSPTVDSLDDLVNNSNLSVSTVQFNFTATDANPSHTILYINGLANETLSSWTSGAKNSFTAITMADGTYNWTVWINDSAGNEDWYEDNYTLTIDTIAPVISNENNISQTSGFYSDEWVYMNATITDATTIVNTVLFSNNFTGNWTNITVTSSTSEYSYNASANNFTGDKHYYWRFYANDTVGNLRTGTLQQFYIYSVPPTPTTPTTQSGSASAYQAQTSDVAKKVANATEDETYGEIAIIKPKFIQRLVSFNRNPNGICDDGENFLIDNDCMVTLQDISTGKVFEHMWLIRYLLVMFVILWRKKSQMASMVGIILLALAASQGAFGYFGKSTAPAKCSIMNIGVCFSSQNPTLGWAMAAGALVLVYLFIKRINRK